MECFYWTILDFSGPFGTFRELPEPFKSFQGIAGHFRTSQECSIIIIIQVTLRNVMLNVRKSLSSKHQVDASVCHVVVVTGRLRCHLIRSLGEIFARTALTDDE